MDSGRLQFEIGLGLAFVLITATVFVVAGVQEESRMARFEEQQRAQAVEEGAELFVTLCAACHGEHGEGGTGPPLNDRHFFEGRLDEVGWVGTLEDYIIATVSSGRPVSTRPDLYPGGGRPAMPAWSEAFGGPLRDDQIRNIAAYVLNWEPSATGRVAAAQILPIPTPVYADPLFRGRQVFLEQGCGACHVISGVSDGQVGPNLTKIGTIAETRIPGMSAEEYIRASILSPSDYVVEGFDDGIMPKDFGQKISEADLDRLVEFLLAQE